MLTPLRAASVRTLLSEGQTPDAPRHPSPDVLAHTPACVLQVLERIPGMQATIAQYAHRLVYGLGYLQDDAVENIVRLLASGRRVKER